MSNSLVRLLRALWTSFNKETSVMSMPIKIEERLTPPWVREPVKVEPSVSDQRVKNAIKVICERFDISNAQSVRIRVEDNKIVCG